MFLLHTSYRPRSPWLRPLHNTIQCLFWTLLSMAIVVLELELSLQGSLNRAL